MGPRADLDDVEKRKFLALPGLELRSLGRPARPVKILHSELNCFDYLYLFKKLRSVLLKRNIFSKYDVKYLIYLLFYLCKSKKKFD
jgi:hypothetical protein